MKSEHDYNALLPPSSTSSSDWDPEHTALPVRRKRSCYRTLRSHRWLLDTCLLLVIVGLLVEKRWQRHAQSHRFELAGDVTGFAPRFSQQIVTFKDEGIFAPEDPRDWWSNETQRAWLGIVPGTLIHP
ncbi:hypothetical protein IQ07DRAFT_291191 [Pyrenochaeta sp. DS3sAY3a]|nr:hypothetical protein IQ07DRAFT_291191 [Pyrenochaeta sp. DS3sAY3a]